MKTRIWELDALRGLCILGMLAVHLVYDLTPMGWEAPVWYTALMDWGGVAFFLLSGICVTLGSNSLRRGLTVLAGGVICTAVTWGMYRLGFQGKSFVIWFGVLHCLGCCMLLWPLFRKWPAASLAVSGILVALTGLYFLSLSPIGSPKWLIILGICYRGFGSSDYFPLLPFLGFFLLGAFLGRTVYRQKQSLLPKVNTKMLPVRLLSWCGRQSLWIYLLHQPVIYGLLALLDL